MEIILVNDHSTDNSFQLVVDKITGKKNIFLVDAVGNGKKNALAEGIAQSKGELILCTDADCIPHQDWAQTMADFYLANNPDMIIAPVVMAYDHSAFQQMQALEFMSLQAATAGAACAGFPIMCNGANLAFTKNVWEKNNMNLKNDRLSGDDMFLMMSVKKQKGNIAYLKSDKAVVFTTPCRNFSDFLNQRKRWVSKSSSYYDMAVMLTAISVFGITAVLILNLVLAIIVNEAYWFSLLFIFFMKIIVDRVLLFSFAKFIKSAPLLRWMLPLSIVYPFYILITSITGLFGKFEWRGRSE